MTKKQYLERKAELYAEAEEAKDKAAANPAAAYFASWMTFFMDEEARMHNAYEQVLAGARYALGIKIEES